MPEESFQQLLERVKSTTSYTELASFAKDSKVAFDQRVKLEDAIAHAFVIMLRAANNTNFIALARQVDCDRPSWLKRYNMRDLVREELDFRFLMAKLPRMGEETAVL